MTVSIHQPQYLPWLGFYDKVDRADVYVILDTVQFKKNEYQNRNRIKTAQGWQWITVPVGYRFPQRIDEVTVNNESPWAHKHRQALVTNYSGSPHFDHVFPALDAILQTRWDRISDLNRRTVEVLMGLLDIDTPVRSAGEWELSDDPTGRLVDICKRLDAGTYLSGAGGRNYLDLAQFEEAGIHVVFQEFSHPEYAQQFGTFEPYMSTVDLLFNCGPESLNIIRSGGP
jgi:hypothetical protein